MVCSVTGYKTFLVCCNVILLFVGVCILILGMKMKEALDALLLDVPVITKTFKAVIATGFFVSVTSITGMTGACYEVASLIAFHLLFLAVIVIMEFALGVTLMVIRTTVESYIESPECNKSCAVTLDAVVLDYALPSSGLMMTIIIVEALMIYCAMKLNKILSETPKISCLPINLRTNPPLLQVPMARSTYQHSPQARCSPRHSPRCSPLPSPRTSPSCSPACSPSRYPNTVFLPKLQTAVMPPPDYTTVVEQPPPPYFEVVPSSSPILGLPPHLNRGRSTICDYP